MPDLAFAGGFTFEDQIFKGLALGAPYVKLVGMARAPIAAAMVGKTIGGRIDDGQLPVYVERFGSTQDEIFVTAPELKHELRATRFEKLPTGAIGLYTYYERLAQGLRQLMAGSRKFALELHHPRRHRRADQGSRRHQRHPVHHGRRQGRGREDPQGQVRARNRQVTSGRRRRALFPPPPAFFYPPFPI